MPAQTVIQLRRDTAANWTSANPVLAAGEAGVETDTNKFKIGNGTSTWSQLAYFINADNPEFAVAEQQITTATVDVYGTYEANDPAGLVFMVDQGSLLGAATVGTSVKFLQESGISQYTYTVDNKFISMPPIPNSIHVRVGSTDPTATSALIAWGNSQQQPPGNKQVSTIQESTATISSTELGYLNGVTSNIQTQLNDKASSNAISSLEASISSKADANNATLFSPTIWWPEFVSPTERVRVIDYFGGSPVNLATGNATVYINAASGANSSYQINIQGRTGNLIGELSAGESITTTFITGHSGGRPTGIQIDGQNVATVLWLGGAPTSVVSGSTYAYTVNITKLYGNVSSPAESWGLRVLASSSEFKV